MDIEPDIQKQLLGILTDIRDELRILRVMALRDHNNRWREDNALWSVYGDIVARSELYLNMGKAGFPVPRTRYADGLDVAVKVPDDYQHLIENNPCDLPNSENG